MSTPSEKRNLEYKLSLMRTVLGVDIKAAKPGVIDLLMKANGLDVRLSKDGMITVVTI